MKRVQQFNSSKRDTQQNHTGNKNKKSKKERIQEIIRKELSLKKGEMKLALSFYQDKLVELFRQSSMISFDLKNSKVCLMTTHGCELAYIVIDYNKKHKKCFYKIKPKDMRVIITNDTEFSSLKSQLEIGGEEIRKNLKPVFESYKLSW